jgi:hypothetical protein
MHMTRRSGDAPCTGTSPHVARTHPGPGPATHRKRKHDPSTPHSYHVMFPCLLTSHRLHAYTQKHPSVFASELACHTSLSTCVSGAWRKTAASWKRSSGASRLGSSPMFDADGTREYHGKHGVRACSMARNLSTFVITSELVADFVRQALAASLSINVKTLRCSVCCAHSLNAHATGRTSSTALHGASLVAGERAYVAQASLRSIRPPHRPA